MRGNWEYICKT